MQPSIQSYYEQIKDIKTEQEFIKELDKRQKQYDDLFTVETLAHLIIDELGRNQQCSIPIKDIHPGMECTVSGTITGIHETKTFTRKNNSTGKLKKCIITDDTGSIPVIFWNDDTECINEDHVQKRASITIVNGYSKKGYYGTELNVGRWSKVKISEKKAPSSLPNHPSEHEKIIGRIMDIKPTTIFFKEDGTEGFIAKVILSCSANTKRTLICWDEQVKIIQQFKKGEYIQIDDASYRYVHGSQEIHVNGKSRITKK